MDANRRRRFAAGVLAGTLSAGTLHAQIPARREALSQAQIESRVRADAARRQGVAEGDVVIVSSAARTWPDAALGCPARRGLFEPQPVAGYRIVVMAGGRRLEFHTDRFGSLRRCTTPDKPVDRIR